MKLSESIHEFAEQVADASDIKAIRTWGYEAAELKKELAVRERAGLILADQIATCAQPEEHYRHALESARKEADREASVDPTQEGLK